MRPNGSGTWTRTKTNGLTDHRATFTLLRILKWSGTPVLRRVNLLVPSQAGSLSPSCPIKNGGRRRALSPHQVVYWCLLFSRQSRCGSPVHLPLKMVFPARIALATFGFADRRSCLLSYGKMVEDRGISPRSTGCRPVVSYSVTDPPWCPRSDFHEDLRR